MLDKKSLRPTPVPSADFCRRFASSSSASPAFCFDRFRFCGVDEFIGVEEEAEGSGKGGDLAADDWGKFTKSEGMGRGVTTSG